MNETIHAEHIKGRYAIICAIIALFGVWLQVQSTSLRQDVLELEEKLTALQDDISALRITDAGILTLEDVVGTSEGFRQERNGDGEAANQYTIKAKGRIVCNLNQEYSHFHALLDQKDTGSNYLFFKIILDGKETGEWTLGSNSVPIPINANLTGVREMVMEVLSLGYVGEAVLTDTEIQ